MRARAPEIRAVVSTAAPSRVGVVRGLWVVAGAVAATLVASICSATPPSEAELGVLRAWAVERLPTEGQWHAKYVSDRAGSYSDVRVGTDWASGAWYSVGPRLGGGRDTDGRRYIVKPTLREEPEWGDASWGGESSLFDRFPSLALRRIVERQGGITSLTVAPDGGYVVSVPWTLLDGDWPRPGEGTQESHTVVLTFDTAGRLTERADLADGRTYVTRFTYDDRSPARFAVPGMYERLGGRWRLIWVREGTEPARTVFGALAVRDLTIATMTSLNERIAQGVPDVNVPSEGVESQTQGASAALDRRESAPPRPAPPPKQPLDQWGRWRLALIGCGAVAVVAGIIAALRRRP